MVQNYLKNYKQFFEDNYLFKNYIIVLNDDADYDDNEDNDYNNINLNNNNNNEVEINLSEYVGENNSSSIEIESDNNSIFLNNNEISLKHPYVIEKENIINISLLNKVIINNNSFNNFDKFTFSEVISR
jgi:hypothetical protein